jgi:hypothetical protein
MDDYAIFVGVAAVRICAWGNQSIDRRSSLGQNQYHSITALEDPMQFPDKER